MPNAIHVCIVTTAHSVDDKRVNSKFAHAFRSAGFRITWVGPSHASFDSGNYNRDGIEYVLAPPILNRIDRIVASHRISKLVSSVPDVDVYYSPDPDAASVALGFSQRNGARVILDLHEIYHGALLDRYLMGLEIKPLRELFRKHISSVCSQCDLVIGVSNAVLEPYCKDKTRSMIIRSCAPSWFAEDPPADVCNSGRANFTIMHGRSNLSRGVREVLHAMALADCEREKLRIIMFYDPVSENSSESRTILSMVNDLRLVNFVDFRKGVPIQEMPGILRECDVGLIAYGRELGIDSLPNRLFEYMAAGLAIIAPVYAREIAGIIEREQCGLLVDFEDPTDIAHAILYLKKNHAVCREMGRRSREAYEERYNWEAEVKPVILRIQTWCDERK